MYRFINLKCHELSQLELIENIFEKSENLLSECFLFVGYLESDLIAITEVLNDSEYFILHENIVLRGKRRIFKGTAVVAKKNEFIRFLSNFKEDIRPMRVLPSDGQGYLVYFDEDGGVSLYGKR